MINKYQDIIEQTFDFPQDGFEVRNNELVFHQLPLMDIIKTYGTPLKITYLPRIREQIAQARQWFKNAMEKVDYKGDYTYCYCTKSSHFSFVMEEVLKCNAQLETSSTYDIEIIKRLYKAKKLTKETTIVSNGFKRDIYMKEISELSNQGFNIIPILDNKKELEFYKDHITAPMNIGIRIASEEEPSFEFYTSRLGIRYKDIKEYYINEIKGDSRFKLKMLHFFINTGVQDSSYYWNELLKCLNVYKSLKEYCPELNSLNIGGGLPIKHSLVFEYDYEYVINEIINQIKQFCLVHNIEEPNIYTEFGSFTVGESGLNIFSVMGEKMQNDTERWYMIDGSFITTLPDIWGISQKFILLAINHWEREYQRVNLGGLTCDSLDYYNSEAHENNIFLPKLPKPDEKKDPLYLGFFNTGAYQESLSGFGGIKHCLIPGPKHIVIDRDENGKFSSSEFSPEQSPEEMLKILGY